MRYHGYTLNHLFIAGVVGAVIGFLASIAFAVFLWSYP